MAGLPPAFRRFETRSKITCKVKIGIDAATRYLEFCLHPKTFAFLSQFWAILRGFAYFFSTISTRELQLLSRGSLVRVQHGSLLQLFGELARITRMDRVTEYQLS